MTMRPARLATLAAVLGAAALIASCAADVLGPGDPRVPFAIASTQRAELAAAIRFAVPAASSALPDRTPLADAFGALADRVAADDRDGAREAIAMARSALTSARAQSPGPAAAIELEMMSLTLEHVTLLAADMPAMLYQAVRTGG